MMDGVMYLVTTRVKKILVGFVVVSQQTVRYCWSSSKCRRWWLAYAVIAGSEVL